MIDGLFGEAMLPVTELAGVPNAIHSTRLRAIQAQPLSLPLGRHSRQLPAWPLKKEEGWIKWNGTTGSPSLVHPTMAGF
jgi:hypothetical protein